jgi:hypothetical protein
VNQQFANRGPLVRVDDDSGNRVRVRTAGEETPLDMDAPNPVKPVPKWLN